MTMKKLLTVALVMVMVLGLMGGVVMADNDCERYGQGYWKQWLADKDNADAFSDHTNEEFLAKLRKPARGNADQILTYQFIAAALNVEIYKCKMPVAVEDAYNAAKTHLHDSESKARRSEILGWKDILEFWNENEYAELLSVKYEGTCDKFGSHVEDTLTLTFSNDIFKTTGNIEVDFGTAQELREAWGNPPMSWVIIGNELTITATSVFNNPRTLFEDKVMTIIGLEDLIGNSVVINIEGVLIEGDLEPELTELSEVLYEGNDNLFGSEIGDTLTLTFSNDIFKTTGNIEVNFGTAQALKEVWGNPPMSWNITDNVLTITATSVFSNPRDLVNDEVLSIVGLKDSCGNSVVVPVNGVSINSD